MIASGKLHVSSAVIAENFGLDPVLTRKDLAMAGVPGRPRRGYPAKELAEAISRTLGWDSVTDAILVGAGSLGKALLGYSGFEEQNLSIVAAFDASSDLIGETLHGVKVHPMEEMPHILSQLRVKLAILTVPNSAAQKCAEALVDAGISGILNFTSIHLTAPKRVTVQNIDIAQSLAVLSHKISKT